MTVFLPGVEEVQVSVGALLCDTMPTMASVFEAHVSTLASHLTLGMPLVLHHLSCSTVARVRRMEVEGQMRRSVAPFTVAKVVLETERAIVAETACKALTRFTLRSGSVSVAAGLIVRALQ